MKIRNKKTGEIREVSMNELNQYGLGGQHNKLVKYQNKGEVKKAPSVVRTKKDLITNRENVSGDSFTGTMRREALAYLPYFKDAMRYLEKGISYVSPDYKSQADRELIFKRHRPVAYPTIADAGIDLLKDYSHSLFNTPIKEPFKDPEGDYEASEEAWRMTLGLPVKNKYIIPSKYRPLNEENKTSKYYTLREDMYNKDLLRQKIKELKIQPGQSVFLPSFAPFVNESYMSQKQFSDVDPLQNFKIGVNKNGKMYFYDKYDFDFEPLSKVTRPYEYEFYNELKTGGEMIKRADGSYSRRGLWDNIRANAGSGKRPTKEMLNQERKIRNQYQDGGEEDVYWRTKKPMVNDPSMDAISKVLLQRNIDKNFIQRAAGFGNQNGIPTRYIDGQDPDSNNMSNLLMGFGDNYVSPTIIETFPNFLGNNSTMLRTAPGQLSYQPNQIQEYIKTPTVDIADYFATKGYKRAANDMYGMNYKQGGSVTLNAGGENHRIYVKTTNRGEGKKGHIMVNHPTMDKGMWDTIDLTKKSGATTIAQGVAATKKWHRENPYMKKYGGNIPMYGPGGKVNTPETSDNLEKLVSEYNLVQEQINKGDQNKNAYVNNMRKIADDLIKKKFVLEESKILPQSTIDWRDPETEEPSAYCIGTSCYLADLAGDKFYPKNSTFFTSNSAAQDYAKDNPDATRYLEQDEKYIEPGDILQFKSGEKGNPFHAFTVYDIGKPNEEGYSPIIVVGSQGHGPMIKKDYFLGPDNKVYTNSDGFGSPHDTQLLKRRNNNEEYNSYLLKRNQLKENINKLDPGYFIPKDDIRFNDYKQTIFSLTKDKFQKNNENQEIQYMNIDNSKLEEIVNKYNDPKYKYDYMRTHNISSNEYDLAVSNMIGIYGAETKFGTQYITKRKAPESPWLIKLANSLGAINQEKHSIGPFQVTYNQLPESYRKTIKAKDLYDPMVGADATMENLTEGLSLLRKRANTTEKTATENNPYSKNITKENYLEYLPYLHNMRKWLKGDEYTKYKYGSVLKGEAGYKNLVDYFRNNLLQISRTPLSTPDPLLITKKQGGQFMFVNGSNFPMYAEGGGIPERYRNMGFTNVGAKKQSTRPGKKWMVLAKKGDDYKVVHGGYKGMQDFKQHHSEQRKENFWSRMGGRNSSKATDPFSPLYWHKRFGTWEYGGQPMAVGGQNVMNPIVKKDNRNWLEYLKN